MPGMTAPEASVTVPLSVPVTVWAVAGGPTQGAIESSAKTAATRRRNIKASCGRLTRKAASDLARPEIDMASNACEVRIEVPRPSGGGELKHKLKTQNSKLPLWPY